MQARWPTECNGLTEGRLGRIIYFFAYSLARLTTADLASNNAGKMMKARLEGYGTNPSVSELGVNIRWRWMDPCRKSMNGGNRTQWKRLQWVKKHLQKTAGNTGLLRCDSCADGYVSFYIHSVTRLSPEAAANKKMTGSKRLPRLTLFMAIEEPSKHKGLFCAYHSEQHFRRTTILF